MKPDDWTFEGREPWPLPRDGEGGAPRKPFGRFPKGGRFLWILLPILLLFVAWPAFVRLSTEWLWFDSLGFSAAFRTRILTRIALYIGSAVLLFSFLALNWIAAWRRSKDELAEAWSIRWNPRFLPWVILGAAAFLSLGNSMGSSAAWETILGFFKGGAFGEKDAIFGKDIGFYVFTLPFLALVRGWVMNALFLALLGTAMLSLPGRLGRFFAMDFSLRPQTRRHLLILASTLVLAWGSGFLLDRWNLLYSPTGIVVGPGYTDIHALLPALTVLFAISVATAVLLLTGASRSRRALWWVLGGLAIAVFVLRSLVPGLMQSYLVKPNEFEREKTYISHHISATLKAFDLDRVTVLDVTPEGEVTPAEVQANSDTIRNIRLWDYGPLLRTYKQLQEIRSYYDFTDVDIDRYRFDGTLRQVMLSARELDPTQLQNRTWVNTHLEFTHGYGLVMNPVNEVGPSGLPLLFIRDLPPKVDVPLEIDRPQIYFGEKTSTYALVKTDVKEFDYPMGESNARSTYEGKGGVGIGTAWRRLLFATRFGDTEIFFTGSLRPESKILYNRNIKDALARLAPFLLYDADPYLVVLDGRLVWVQDAYTATDRYPYSRPVALADPTLSNFQGANYLRNSVKATVDAYDGTITFYAVDEKDPLLSLWRSVFPSLFKPASAMSEELRNHLRYPEGLFEIQSSVFRTYHMTDPNTFYNKEDVWTITPEGNRKAVSPNYTILKLLGEREPEFALIIPFLPVGRNNMIAWMAGRSDGENYGKLVVYKFPKQKLIFGPAQIEALIDQNPEISAQLSLWSQRGSEVIRGDLLVIPVGKGLLYVQPLYLKAERGDLPELKRVILSTGGRVAMAETFDEALTRVVGVQARKPSAPAKPGAVPPAPSPSPTGTEDLKGLAREARNAYEAAEAAQRAGDWARYGEEIKKLSAILERMTGNPAP